MILLKRLIIVITLVFGSTVLADIHKWIDENGVTQFSNTPPNVKKPAVVEPSDEEVNKSKENLTASEDVLKEVDSAFNSKNYSKALALLQPLAEQGNPRAQNGLAVIYDQGLGVPKNLNVASKWYRKAADQGYVMAQSYLASMYAKGEGVPKDSAEAAKWYRKASENGNDFAQFNLALMYAKGEGVTQDYKEAYRWIRKAAAQGYPLHFNFDIGWKIGHYAAVPNQYVITEYIREGDDINNWKELLTIQSFPPFWGGPSPEDALNKLKEIREKECPGVTTWNIINQDENSILYEWQATPCLGWPDQHEIARIIYRKYDKYFLHYALKATQISDEQRSKWVKKFSEAK